ncbi:MAG: hypothetical protein DMD73_08930 [Gemmatimonadetes bacterium]|nr:MAG: hypothetical protein DMD73_08930 [Gemmatimonadota bacterium]
MTAPSRIAFVTSLPVALLAASLAGQASVDTAATLRTADTAAHTWLALVDKGELAKSWDEGALVLQLGVTETKWEQLVRSARAPFEPFGARHQIMARYTTDPPNAPPGQYVLLQYQTDVSGGRHVVETVVPTLDGKRGWRVSGYFIRLEQ